MSAVSRTPRLIALAFAVVLGLFASAILVTVSTESGSRWIVAYLVGRVNETENLDLRVGEIGGHLLSSIRFSDLLLRTDAAELEIDQLTLAWRPLTYFSGQIQVREIKAEQVTLKLLENSASTKDTHSTLQLPSVAIEALSIHGFESNFTVDYPVTNLETRLILEGQTVTAEELGLHAEAFELKGNLQLDLAAELAVTTELEWQTQAGFFGGAPEASGRLALQGNLNELQISHELLTPFQLNSAGSITQLANTAQTQLALEHTAANLDLQEFISGLQLTGVDAQTQGAINGLQFSATADMSVADQTGFNARVEGLLEPESVRVDLLEISRADSSLESEFTVSLVEALDLVGSYRASNIAIHQLAPLYTDIELQPLFADANGSIQLSQSQSGLMVDSELERMRILLGNEEVLGSGSFRIEPGLISIPGITLESQSAEVMLTGAIAAAGNNLRWQLSLGNLEQFLPTVSGTIAGQGEILGTLEQPFTNGTLSVSNLVTSKLRLSSGAIDVTGAPADFTAEISLVNLGIELADVTEEFETAVATVREQDGVGSLALSTQSGAGSIAFAMQGSSLLAQPFTWNGRVDELRLETVDHQWLMQAPVTLDFDGQTISLANTCLVSANTELCASLESGLDDSHTTFSLLLQNMELAELENMQSLLPLQSFALLQLPELPRGVNIEGRVSINASGETAGSDGLDLESVITISDLLMLIDEDPDNAIGDNSMTAAQRVRRFHWGDIAVTADRKQQSWELTAQGELDYQEFDGERLQQGGLFELALSIDPATAIQGTSTLRFDDLGWLEAYVPDISGVSGRLNSQIGLSGNIQQPRLEGFFSLENSGFTLDSWGVRIDNFRGMATTTAEGEVSIAASAQSENGQLAMTGTGSGLLDDNFDLSLQLTGDEFQLLSSPELSAHVSPEIALMANSESISLRGNIQVPHLFIGIGALPETAIDVSSDVVIVNYPANEPELARSLAAVENRFMNIPLTANLQLELGEDVRFSGLGLDTRLQGALTVEQLANGSNRTFGELTVVEGSYSLYGQTLQLEEGELLFIGPYDNPGLDIRATRTVEDTVVGLQMNGTLRNIQSELFSTPSLPENDVIALLVTGRPFSQIGQTDQAALLGSVARLGLERGRVISERIRTSLGLDTLAITNTGSIDETLLTVGKYITPSIFVRYGLGLFDNQSKISVDYDLTETIKLQAESGENQSLDVTYSIEN